ncbi:MAG: manganese efflux pump MntP family protein [Clostridiales bacterium]|nr:manganese efflux pump MntP family protein [Clostridiales bacterium]
MNEWLTIGLLGLGLTMDAFAVSLTDGLSITGINKRQMLFIAAVFGLMQGVMPVSGYYLGRVLIGGLDQIRRYLSFAILAFLGGKMLVGGVRAFAKKAPVTPKKFSAPAVLLEGVATSLDALFAGVSLTGLAVPVPAAGGVIAAITFCLVCAAVFLGARFGRLLQNKQGFADILGGVILLGIAIKFLFFP